MEHRSLGRTGLKVSPICIGAMSFGGETDAQTSARIIARAAERGVNLIDTANIYNRGKSEEIVGAAVKGRRDQWVIATKTRSFVGEGPNGWGLSRKQIFQAVEDSLRRLGTDYIDIYYMHYEDLTTPLGESVRAMGDLIRQGKIRYFGVSNFRSWRIAEICALCDQLGIDRPASSSPLYNIVNRQAEIEVLPACDHFGVGVVSYSPLARSVLAGVYRPGETPAADTRAGREDPRLKMHEWRPESLEIAEKVRRHAEARGLSAVQFAVAWVIGNWMVTGAVTGPVTEDHMESYLTALDYRLTVEDEAFVDSLVAVGSQSTLGHNDPYYPIEGRPPRALPRRENTFVEDIRTGLREQMVAAAGS